MSEIPNTVVTCDGCGEDLNLLNKHISMGLRVKREVLSLSVPQQTGEIDDIPAQEVTLASLSGRGVLRTFHDFKCLDKWVNPRKGYELKLEPHYEDEIFVPEDNRSPEELVEAGELPSEILALSKAFLRVRLCTDKFQHRLV